MITHETTLKNHENQPKIMKPPLVQKRDVTNTGPQLTSFGAKNVTDSGPQPTSFGAKNVTDKINKDKENALEIHENQPKLEKKTKLRKTSSMIVQSKQSHHLRC